MRSTCVSCRSTSLRMLGVMVTCRPVSSRRMASQSKSRHEANRVTLIQDFALVGGGDLQFFAVLGDGTPRQLQSLALQDAHNLRVAQRLARILLLDDLPDALLDRHRRDRLAVRARDAAVEEVLHLEHAL